MARFNWAAVRVGHSVGATCQFWGAGFRIDLQYRFWDTGLCGLEFETCKVVRFKGCGGWGADLVQNRCPQKLLMKKHFRTWQAS